MDEKTLTNLKDWAQSAIDDYDRELRSGGEPVYPEMALALFELIGTYSAAVAHNEILLARLRKQAKEMEAIGAGGVSVRLFWSRV